MKTSSLLVACGLVLFSTLLMKASTAEMNTSASRQSRERRERAAGRTTAAVSPATPSSAASAHSSTGSSMVWPQTGARAPTATWRRTISSSRPPAWRRGFSSCNCAGDGIRTPTIPCSGRSMRMTSARTARTPVISAISARTASSGSRSHRHQTSGSSTGDQRAVGGNVSGRVAERSDGERRRPHRTGQRHPVAARPERGRRLSAGRAHSRRCRSRRSARLTNHAQVQNAPPQQLLDDLSSFQRVLFTNQRVRALSNAVVRARRRYRIPIRRLNCARTEGKGRLRTRLRPVPRRPRTVDAPGDPQRPSCSGDSISQHPEPVSASRRSRPPASPSRRARHNWLEMRAHTTSRCRSNASPGGLFRPGHRSADVVRSRPRAADRVRGGPAPQGRLGQVRCARTSRHQQDCAVLPSTTAPPRSKRWSITTSSSSSARRRTSSRAASCRRLQRPTACTSIDGRLRKSAPRCLAYLRKL